MENTVNTVTANVINKNGIVNNNQKILNNIKALGSKKEQLKKTGEEFETMFITKMLETMDKTVDKEGGILGEESKYVDTFKNFVYQEVGRQMASNKHTTLGIASQIYKQMERYVQE